MRAICITFSIVAIIVLSVIGLNLPSTPTEQYLRIHIRANSNEGQDQAVKYLIKDEVVKFLTPFISQCDSKEKAEQTLYSNLSNIERVADLTLKKEGFSYKAKAEVKTEAFPTRVYGQLQLESGYYDALIINLGSGEGDNWWCVIYPPLCFVEGNGNYTYISKIKQIIDRFFNFKENKQ